MFRRPGSPHSAFTSHTPTSPGRARTSIRRTWSRSPPYACSSSNAADCDARIVMSTSTDGGNTWPTPVPVDPPANDPKNPANPQGRGHQLQPAMTFAAGKLLITWLDQRLDHTEGVLSCLTGPGTCTSVNQLVDVREAKGNLDPSCTNSVLAPPSGPACY